MTIDPLRMDEEVRKQIEEAKRLHDDVGHGAGLSDEDVVWLARRGSGEGGYVAEMARRQIKASADLQAALETTSRRLYVLTGCSRFMRLCCSSWLFQLCC